MRDSPGIGLFIAGNRSRKAAVNSQTDDAV
jgi:hypothetical protein